jgi:AraC-like DNA-binding protein
VQLRRHRCVAIVGNVTYWYKARMPCFSANLSRPPLVVQAWSNVAWWAPRTEHHLDGLWQLHVYSHRGTLEAHTPSGVVHAVLAPGFVSLLPPSTRSRYDAPGRARFSCLHLRLAAGSGTAVAALAASDALAADLVASAAASREPQAASALAWAALWRLAAAAAPIIGPVAQARALIETRLDDPPSVSELARKAGISAAHLRRLFRSELGLGVKPWIQRRRGERARHLLAHSDHSVAAIAQSLGIDDLQRFNKLLRRQFGKSPRALR